MVKIKQFNDSDRVHFRAVLEICEVYKLHDAAQRSLVTSCLSNLTELGHRLFQKCIRNELASVAENLRYS